MDIVLATRNKKKAEEIRRITVGLPVTIFTLDDFPGCPEVVEDGMTFEENAIKKAVSASQCSGKPALADDSGLEVAALGGAPGIHSARFAGEPANDRKNIEKLLSLLREEERRKARFVCCIAFSVPNEGVHVFHGTVDGTIGREPRGSLGFGYDPIFYPDGYARTFAEMTRDEKDTISHRGKALEAFKQFLAKRLAAAASRSSER